MPCACHVHAMAAPHAQHPNSNTRKHNGMSNMKRCWWPCKLNRGVSAHSVSQAKLASVTTMSSVLVVLSCSLHYITPVQPLTLSVASIPQLFLARFDLLSATCPVKPHLSGRTLRLRQSLSKSNRLHLSQMMPASPPHPSSPRVRVRMGRGRRGNPSQAVIR